MIHSAKGRIFTVNIILISMFSAGLFKGISQPLPPRFYDYNWMYFNQNITAQNSFGVGFDLTGGLDESYVQSILNFDLIYYHAPSALHISTLSVLDISIPINDKYNRFEFQDSSVLNFADILLYLGEKYAYFSPYRDFRMALFPDSAQALIEAYQLSKATKFVLEEWFFLDASENTWFRALKKVGFIAPETDDTPVLWLAFEQIDTKAFARIKYKEYEGFSDFGALFDAFPYQTEFIEMSSSKLFDDVNDERHIRLLEAPFIADFIGDLYRAERASGKGFKIKKEKYRSKYLEGILIDGKPDGQWRLKGRTDFEAEMGFNRGVANGRYSISEKSGGFMETGTFSNGVREGEMKQFYSANHISAVFNFKNGKPDGNSVLYYPTGKVKAAASYVAGQAQGKFESFYEDGLWREKGAFENGKVFGDWLYQIKLPKQACGYLNDNELYGLLHKEALIGAYLDCIANYTIYYEHKQEKGCVEGICVIPHLKGEVK
jgi:antitoxin component YwqK of YwqJK toxin-antitoxin module